MNNLKQQILEQVVNPALRNLNKTLVGHIESINPNHMSATISFNNPHGSGVKILENVPIQISTGGVSQSGPFVGDKVIIEFPNFNPHNPIIVAVIDTNYDKNTREQRQKHSRKGAYVPDSICNRTSWDLSSNLWE